MIKSSPARLRELMSLQGVTLVPLALDPLSAKLAETTGFEAL